MVSNINPEEPRDVTGNAHTGLKANFAAAKAEIEALQASTGGSEADIVALQEDVELLQLKATGVLTAAEWGAVGNGVSRPVSQWLIGGTRDKGYADLAAMQVDYPHVTALTDEIDWAAIQKAIDVAAADGASANRGGPEVQVHNGNFISNKPVTLVNPSSGLRHVNIKGHGGRINNAGTKITFSGMSTDQPAVVIQGARHVRWEGIAVIGKNVFPVPVDHKVLGGVSGNIADYIMAGVSNGQYNPYCGIAIDPFTEDPGGGLGYPGATYGKSVTSTVDVIDTEINGFAVGAIVSPSLDGSLAERVKFQRCYFIRNAVSLASAGSQNRDFTAEDCAFTECHTMIDTLTYGTQSGNCPNLLNCLYGVSFQILNLNGANVSNGYIHGFHCESTNRLGNVGSSTSSAQSALKITSGKMTMAFINRSISYLRTYQPVIFEDIQISIENDAGFFNIMGSGVVTFNHCAFVVPSAENWLTFPFINNEGTELVYGFNNCTIANSMFTPTAGNKNILNDHQLFRVKSTAEDKSYVNRNGRTITYSEDGITYPIKHRKGTTNRIDITSPSFVGTTLTFNTVSTSKLLVGDVLYWKPSTTVLPNGPAGQRVPFAIVTAIAAPAVTCTCLLEPSEVDQTFLQPYIGVYGWVTKAPLIGTFTSGTAITMTRSMTGILSVGDWIDAGRGTWTGQRVLSVSGANITISADVGLNGTTQEFGGLHALGRHNEFEAQERSANFSIGEATAYRSTQRLTSGTLTITFDATSSGTSGEIHNSSGNTATLTAGTAAIVGATTLANGAVARFTYSAPNVVGILT